MNRNRTTASRAARFVSRFVNGAHVVLDRATYKHVALRGLAKDAAAEAARRNGAGR